MSYSEYADLFKSAQQNKNAKYKCFVFDLKNSRQLNDEIRYEAQIKSILTFNAMTKDLKELEIELGKKILIDEYPVTFSEEIANNKNTYAFLNNPTILNGDCFAFYCYNNVSAKDIKSLFLEQCKKNENEFVYNFSEGNFETLHIKEKNTKLWIGYIAQFLSYIKTDIIQYKNEEKIM